MDVPTNVRGRERHQPVQPPLWTLGEPQEGRLKVQIGQAQDFSVAAEMAGEGRGAGLSCGMCGQ